MIRVILARYADGRFGWCRAEGHARYDAAGKDIVCAAVTILLRTTMETLSRTAGIVVTSDAPERGSLDFSAEAESPADVPEAVKAAGQLGYAVDFLQAGLLSLQTEFPGHVLFVEEVIK
ncbi:MAG: ribosomal-processing cysteine protease Prp [Treponema sp.]|jgi:uncharacterized protein YsxB (DUF464 family)|nr:ribosomal-processing cysteine protease Prp [Treponema sp.]